MRKMNFNSRRWQPELRRYMSVPGNTGDWQQLNEYLREIEYGSGITFSNVTLKFSTVAGTAFITQVSGSIPWSLYLNRLVTISDGTNSATGYVRAVGTGETYGSNLITGWTGTGTGGTNPFETFTSADDIITSAINSADSGICISNDYNAGTVAGGLFRLETNINIASGSLTAIASKIAYASGAANGVFSIDSGLAGIDTYKTLSSLEYAVIFYTTTAVNFSIDYFRMRKVLTPDISGCTLSSTPGGPVQSLASNSGINPNAASFTLTVSR